MPRPRSNRPRRSSNSRSDAASFERVVRAALSDEERRLANASQTLVEWADDTVAEMQANAPWTDRTGDARRGLSWGWRTAGYASGSARVVLRHRVWYGKFLELAHGGRFAIILPTLEPAAQELMRRLRSAWNA